MSVYIIAEAGINHNGSFATAVNLISAAKERGADAIKFQTYVADDICRKDNPEYAWLKHCELSHHQFWILKGLCDSIGIDFISTPDTVRDAEFLETLGMRYMKIGSANANNAFLESINHTVTPKIVSLGMCDRPFTYCHNVACWMHCVSAYPCPVDQANMACVGAGFYGDTLGFSDHTMGERCAIMAVARGAKFIEKHFTLDRYAEGPDHRMSMQPAEFRSYVEAIRMTELALGDGVRRVMPCEQKTIEQLKARKLVSEYGV